jgi:hypothetical protein
LNERVSNKSVQWTRECQKNLSNEQESLKKSVQWTRESQRTKEFSISLYNDRYCLKQVCLWEDSWLKEPTPGLSHERECVQSGAVCPIKSNLKQQVCPIECSEYVSYRASFCKMNLIYSILNITTLLKTVGEMI